MTEASKSPEQIEREISGTRAEIGSTLEALERKLSPGEVLDQMLGYAKDGGGQFAVNMGRTIRDNPLPVALMGLSLGWLMLGGSNLRGGNQGSETQQGAGRRPEPVGPRGATAYGATLAAESTGYASRTMASGDRPAADSAKSEKTHGSSTVDKAKSKVGSVADSLSGKAQEVAATASDLVDKASHQASEIQSTIRHRVDETSDRAGELATRARSSMRHAGRSAGEFAKENPLMVAGLAVAAGAALAAMIPQTRREHEIAGEKSDELKEAATASMKEQAGKAKQIAEAAYQSGKEEAKRKNLTPEAARREADRIAEAGADIVKAAAKSAESEAGKSSSRAASATAQSTKQSVDSRPGHKAAGSSKTG